MAKEKVWLRKEEARFDNCFTKSIIGNGLMKAVEDISIINDNPICVGQMLW